MERIELGIQDGTGNAKAVLSYDEDDDACRVELEYQGASLIGDGADFFDVLCDIRQVLEKKGALLNCYGGSLNVYPSGMTRDMGAGLKAYKLTHGQRGRMQDLVRIFDTGPDVQPATVAAQRAYFEAWLKSF
jgi:hypothetical protein